MQDTPDGRPPRHGGSTAHEIDAETMAAREPEPLPVSLSRRSVLGTVITVGFVAIAITLVVAFLVEHRSQVAQAWDRVTFWPLLGALGFGLLASYCPFLSWRLLLGGLGSQLPIKPSRKVFFLGQLGKYIPGGVWAVVAQVSLAKSLRVPRTRSAAAGLLAILVGVVVATVLAAVSLAIAGRQLLGAYAPYLLFGVALVGLLHPGVLVAVGRFVARITGRTVDIERIPARVVVRAVVAQTVGQALMGLHLYLVIGTVGGTWVSPVLAVGLVNLAFAAGLVVVVAPAGAGVREAVMIVGLTPYMTSGSAVLVALMSRLLTVVADFLLALAATWTGRTAPGAGTVAHRKPAGEKL